MMHKLILFLLSFALVFSGYAFADTASKPDKIEPLIKVKKCFYPKSKKRAPDWVCTSRTETLSLAAVGSSAKSDAGLAFMEQMATTSARVALAKKIRGAVQEKIAAHEGSQTQPVNSVDNNLMNKITDEQLQGTKIMKTAYGPRGRLYVLIGFDEAGAQKLQDSISSRYLEQKRN